MDSVLTTVVIYLSMNHTQRVGGVAKLGVVLCFDFMFGPGSVQAQNLERLGKNNEDNAFCHLKHVIGSHWRV